MVCQVYLTSGNHTLFVLLGFLGAWAAVDQVGRLPWTGSLLDMTLCALMLAWSVLLFLPEEIVQRLIQCAANRNAKADGGVVIALLNRVDRLPRHAHQIGQRLLAEPLSRTRRAKPGGTARV